MGQPGLLLTISRGEEVAEVIEVDAGVALPRHQRLQRLFPIAHPGRLKPERLGFSRKDLACLALHVTGRLSVTSAAIRGNRPDVDSASIPIFK